MLEKVDNLIIGWGMAYTFAKAIGGNIGNSLVEIDKLNLAKSIIAKALFKLTGAVGWARFQYQQQQPPLLPYLQ